MAELLEDGALLRIAIDKILSRAVMEQIESDLAAHENDRHLKLVVIHGASGNFSYGASVEEHRKDVAPAMLRGLSRLVRRIAHFPAPVAAFVEGRCLGGGFELALACHLIFVTGSAQLGCPEIKLGVFPPVLAAIGPSKIGGALSDRLVLTGETISGAEAKPWALPAASFDDVLAFFRMTLAKASAQALRIATQAIRRDDARLEELEKLYVEQVLESRDGNEGIEAFIARRAPKWEDA